MKTTRTTSPADLTDDELIASLKDLVSKERGITALLIAHLAELDRRRIHLAQGSSSLFTYCTSVLHFSEHAAYLRIEAARAARRFPVILDRIADGSLHLSAVSLLYPHLTEDNHLELLEAARHRSKRQVEENVAAIRPLPPVPATVRKLPESRVVPAVTFGDRRTSDAAALPSGAGTTATLPGMVAHGGAIDGREGSVGEIAAASTPPLPLPPTPPLPTSTPPAPRSPAVAPLSPGRYKVQFTTSAAMIEKLREARDLLRHQAPDADTAQILEWALTEFVERLVRKKSHVGAKPSKRREARQAAAGSRVIPATVKREVWIRDRARCAFVGQSGERCRERGGLEFHHLEPHAVGGPATVENISLRCRAHNQYESELCFGRRGASIAREQSSAPYLAESQGRRCQCLQLGPDRVGTRERSA